MHAAAVSSEAKRPMSNVDQPPEGRGGMREVGVGQVAAAGSGEGGRRGLGRQTALRGRSGRLERRRAPLSGIWGRAAPENADLGENSLSGIRRQKPQPRDRI